MGTSLNDSTFFNATKAKKKNTKSSVLTAHRDANPRRRNCVENRKWQDDVHDEVRVLRQVSEPMRYKDYRSTFSFLPEVSKQSVFSFGIEGRTGLVHSNELDGGGKEAHERPGTEK